MKINLAIILAACTVATSIEALAGETSSQPANSQIDAQANALSDAQSRVLGKAVAFCTAQHLPQGLSLDETLKSFVMAFSEGTKAAMSEIVKTDKEYIGSAPVYRDKDFEMMDKQADALLQGVQDSPIVGCQKLAFLLESGTTAKIKESTLQSYREYKVKRAEYCARAPKPQSCE